MKLLTRLLAACTAVLCACPSMGTMTAMDDAAWGRYVVRSEIRCEALAYTAVQDMGMDQAHLVAAGAVLEALAVDDITSGVAMGAGPMLVAQGIEPIQVQGILSLVDERMEGAGLFALLGDPDQTPAQRALLEVRITQLLGGCGKAIRQGALRQPTATAPAP